MVGLDYRKWWGDFGGLISLHFRCLLSYLLNQENPAKTGVKHQLDFEISEHALEFGHLATFGCCTAGYPSLAS